jgi:hypothetical protein
MRCPVQLCCLVIAALPNCAVVCATTACCEPCVENCCEGASTDCGSLFAAPAPERVLTRVEPVAVIDPLPSPVVPLFLHSVTSLNAFYDVLPPPTDLLVLHVRLNI